MRRIAVIALLLLLAACANPPPPVERHFNVFFTTNSAALEPDSRRIIDEIAIAAQQDRPASILVEGEADGNTPGDLELANQRAVTVVQALISEGIEPAKVAKTASLAPSGTTGIAAHVVHVHYVKQ